MQIQNWLFYISLPDTNQRPDYVWWENFCFKSEYFTWTKQLVCHNFKSCFWEIVNRVDVFKLFLQVRQSVGGQEQKSHMIMQPRWVLWVWYKMVLFQRVYCAEKLHLKLFCKVLQLFLFLFVDSLCVLTLMSFWV